MAAGASNAHVVSGAYRSEVSNSAVGGALNGRWRLALRGGTYTFRFTGHTLKNVIISGPLLAHGRKDHIP